MPRITPADELHLIESIVAAHHGGIGIAEIEAAIAGHLPDEGELVPPDTTELPSIKAVNP